MKNKDQSFYYICLLPFLTDLKNNNENTYVGTFFKTFNNDLAVI